MLQIVLFFQILQSMLIGSDCHVSIRNYQLYSSLFDRSVLKNISSVFFKGPSLFKPHNNTPFFLLHQNNAYHLSGHIKLCSMRNAASKKRCTRTKTVFLCAKQIAGNGWFHLVSGSHKYKP